MSYVIDWDTEIAELRIGLITICYGDVKTIIELWFKLTGEQ